MIRIFWKQTERKIHEDELFKLLVEQNDWPLSRSFPTMEFSLRAQNNVFYDKTRIRAQLGAAELSELKKEMNRLAAERDRDIHSGKTSFLTVEKSGPPKAEILDNNYNAMLMTLKMLLGETVVMEFERQYPRLKLIGKELSLEPSKQGQEAERLELISIVRWLQDRDVVYQKRLDDLETRILELMEARVGGIQKKPESGEQPKIMIVGLLEKYVDIVRKEYGDKLNLRFYGGMSVRGDSVEGAMKGMDMCIAIPKYMSPAIVRSMKHAPGLVKLTGGLTQLRKVLTDIF